MMNWAWGHTWWGFIWMALFWVAVIALLVWAVRQGGSSGRRALDPQQILDERFARGEISEKEYRERKQVLDPGRR